MSTAERPVVTFLRLAGWSEERIAEVVAAHGRGEVYKATITIGGDVSQGDEIVDVRTGDRFDVTSS